MFGPLAPISGNLKDNSCTRYVYGVAQLSLQDCRKAQFLPFLNIASFLSFTKLRILKLLCKYSSYIVTPCTAKSGLQNKNFSEKELTHLSIVQRTGFSFKDSVFPNSGNYFSLLRRQKHQVISADVINIFCHKTKSPFIETDYQ